MAASYLFRFLSIHSGQVFDFNIIIRKKCVNTIVTILRELGRIAVAVKALYMLKFMYCLNDSIES